MCTEVSSVMRRIAFVGLLACNRSVAPTPAPPPEPKPERTRPSKPLPTPEEQLALHFNCEVTIDAEVEIEGGTVVAFSYESLEAEIGELQAQGQDVESELEEAYERCIEERSKWPEEQRMEHEAMDGDTCETQALVERFGEAGRASGCGVLGVALFDEQRRLLHHKHVVETPSLQSTPWDTHVYGDCLAELAKFEVQEYGPGGGPSLLIVASHGYLGHYERGGYGLLSTTEELRVMAVRATEDDELFTPLLIADLGSDSDEGGCSSGTRADWEFTEDGDFLLVATPYNDCEASDCEEESCEAMPEHFKATWDRQTLSWSDVEEVSG